jgi:hypothetical protein
MSIYSRMDPIDLATSLTDMKFAQTATQIQYAVAAKVLKLANDQGDSVAQLLQAATEGFDQALAKANGATDPSRTLDTYA